MRRGIVITVLLLTTTAVAQTVQFNSDCPGLEPELIAAFEARARAELAVRQVGGNLRLRCDAGVTIEWAPEHGELQESTVTRESVTSDVLFERFNELLLFPDEPPPSETSAPPTATPPPAPPAAPNAPLSRSEAKPKAATARAVATQQRGTTSPGTFESDSSPNTEREPLSTPARVSVGALATLWNGAPVGGLQVSGSMPVSGRWSSLAELQVAQAIPPPAGFSARQLQAQVGLGWALTDSLVAQASLLAGAVAVQAPANFTLTAAGSASFCDLGVGDSGGICGYFGARAALFAELSRGPLRPELGVGLDWSPRTIRALALEPGGGPRELHIGSLRPLLVVRVAWVPDDLTSEQ